MIESYGVERFDEVTAKQLKEVGFTSELMGHLASCGVTKDEVVAAFERAADENLKLDALIGGIVMEKAGPVPTHAPVEDASSLPASEPAAE